MSKEIFEQELIKLIYGLFAEYDSAEEFKSIASVKASSSGNIKHPETKKRYGYKIIIGDVDFFEEE